MRLLSYLLRKSVADEFQLGHYDQVLQEWITLYQSLHPREPYRSELLFLHGLVDPQTTLKNIDRASLARNLMSPRLYWGDEIARKILQDVLRINILVITNDLKGNFDPRKPLLFLHLKNAHYEPVLFQE